MCSSPFKPLRSSKSGPDSMLGHLRKLYSRKPRRLSPEKDVSFKASRTTEVTLDIAQLILNVTARLADGVLVPGVNSVVDAAAAIVELIQVSLNLRLLSNRKLTPETYRPSDPTEANAKRCWVRSAEFLILSLCYQMMLSPKRMRLLGISENAQNTFGCAYVVCMNNKLFNALNA